MDGRALLEALPASLLGLVRACGRAAGERSERAYLVGGGVRDLVLGRPCEDVDVVVEGDGLAVAQAIARAHGGQLTRYHAFQTARVDLPGGGRLDVATARSEEYPKPGVLPWVRPGSLAEDLARRDFTINTLAIDLGPVRFGELVDPFEGRADLEAGVIRILHERSFVDDPTRMLRAVRFALRFGYELDEAVTARCLREAVVGGYLDEISGDRLRREIEKLFTEQPVAGPLDLQERDLLEQVHGGLAADAAALQRLAAVARWVAEAGDPLQAAAGPAWMLVLATTAARMAPQARWQLVKRLNLARENQDTLIHAGLPWDQACERLEDPDVDRVTLTEILDRLDAGAVVVGLGGLDPAVRLAGDLRSYLLGWRWERPLLGGDDLIAAGCEAGPGLGEVLRALRRARIEGRVESIEQERALAAEIIANQPN